MYQITWFALRDVGRPMQVDGPSYQKELAQRTADTVYSAAGKPHTVQIASRQAGGITKRR
jgi:hypothetical protein